MQQNLATESMGDAEIVMKDKKQATRQSHHTTVVLCKQCMEAADITGTTFEEVDKCHGSAEGENLLHDIGVETANLDPPLYFIPWILLDEVNPGYARAAAYITLAEAKARVGWRDTGPKML